MGNLIQDTDKKITKYSRTKVDERISNREEKFKSWRTDSPNQDA